jgi:hypothetical protein
MRENGMDWVARLLARSGSRRGVALAIAVALTADGGSDARGKKNRTPSSVAARKRRKTKQRGSRNKKNKSSSDKNVAFSRDCNRFVIAAGPNRDDKFQHIDDDLLITLIPKGKKGDEKVLLEDDNNSPNGNNGAHLKVNPFTARVGDRIHIVARNEVAGGCELDEIWLHCIEGQGGRVKLLDAVTPDECRPNANKIGVFLDETVRIKNK